MANQCATLNADCLIKQGIKCPAFEADKNCWEYDWVPMFQNLPQAEKQARQFMEQKCPSCGAFRDPMKRMIERIQQL